MNTSLLMKTLGCQSGLIAINGAIRLSLNVEYPFAPY
jgi:hypothetical protein